MRAFLPAFVLAIAVAPAVGQTPPPSDPEVQISALTIDANGVPPEIVQNIAASFAQFICPQDELAFRVHRAFDNLGYLRAQVDSPTVTVVGESHGRPLITALVHVSAGSDYNLGEITFEKATQFPSDQLRSLFDIHAGEPMSVTRIGSGLEQLRQLYSSKGYIDCIAIPELIIDEAGRRVDLRIELDEGKSFNFGQLLLEGIEPHTGAINALQASWKELQGRQYAPSLLNSWLTANAAEWPGITDLKRMNLTRHTDSPTVDVRLALF